MVPAGVDEMRDDGTSDVGDGDDVPDDIQRNQTRWTTSSLLQSGPHSMMRKEKMRFQIDVAEQPTPVSPNSNVRCYDVAAEQGTPAKHEISRMWPSLNLNDVSIVYHQIQDYHLQVYLKLCANH